MNYQTRVANLEEAFHGFEHRARKLAKDYHDSDLQTGVRNFQDIAGMPLWEISSALLSLKPGSERHDKGLLEKAEKRVRVLEKYFDLMKRYSVYAELELADIRNPKQIGAFTDLRQLTKPGKGIDITQYVEASTTRLTTNKDDVNRFGEPIFEDFMTFIKAGESMTQNRMRMYEIAQGTRITPWHAYLIMKAERLLGKPKVR